MRLQRDGNQTAAAGPNTRSWFSASWSSTPQTSCIPTRFSGQPGPLQLRDNDFIAPLRGCFPWSDANGTMADAEHYDFPDDGGDDELSIISVRLPALSRLDTNLSCDV